MKRAVLFGAGFAGGYVLGARAGRERYEQIARGATRAWRGSGLDRGARQVSDQAAVAAREASGAVADAATARIGEVTDLVRDRARRAASGD